jgi:hypothetical protein
MRPSSKSTMNALKELKACCEYMSRLEGDSKYRSFLHVAKSLEQSAYDASTDDANHKQVITSSMMEMMKEASSEPDEYQVCQYPMLVEKQLWLWTIGQSIDLSHLIDSKLTKAGTIITACPMRYYKSNELTLQRCLTHDLRQNLFHSSLSDVVKHICTRTVAYIEAPFKAGLETGCLSIYSYEIQKTVRCVLFRGIEFTDSSQTHELSECYGEFRRAINPNNRGSMRAKYCGIATEYEILVKTSTILGEIKILQRVIEEQHDAVKGIWNWADRLTVEDSGPAETSSGNENEHATSDKSNIAGPKSKGYYSVMDEIDVLRSQLQQLRMETENLITLVCILLY